MKKRILSLGLVLALCLGLAAPALADEPGDEAEEKRLWVQWVNWEEDPELEGEPETFNPDLVPNQEIHMAFFTGEEGGEKLTPVPVDKLEADEGLKVHFLCPGVKGKEHFATVYATDWNREYTLSYNGYSMTFLSRLPDLGVYSGPEATIDNFVDYLHYSPVWESRTAYIISTAKDVTHGRHLAGLAVSKECEDKDSFKLEKVSGSVYKWTLTGSIDTFRLTLLLDVTWENAQGDSWTETKREFRAEQNASILTSEKQVTKYDREKPARYADVKGDFTNTLTLKAGEDKSVYFAYTHFDEGQDAWVMRNTGARWLTVSDSALKLTEDQDDPFKLTLRCDVPGTYTFGIHDVYPVIDAMYRADGTQYTAEEVRKWDEETPYLIEDGKLMVYTDLETDETAPFEEAFPGQKIDFHLWEDDWFPVTVTVEAGEPPFPDVAETAWYAPAARFVSNRGYMTGNDKGQFNPDGKTTGAEFAQILYNRAGKPAPAEGASFQGGIAGKWYASAILWAAGEGIITDTGAAAVDPEKPLTRQQIALMLHNAAGRPDGAGDLSVFADAKELSDWAKAAMEWAVGAKVFQGGDGKLNPAGTATRAEVAQILMNYYG